MSWNFRRLDNGDLLFIGPIPETFDGYEQDPRHKNTWHPLWEPCVYRTEKPFRCPQGRLRLATMCSHFDCIVSYAKCSTCLAAVTPEEP